MKYIIAILTVSALFLSGCQTTGQKASPVTLELAVGVASDATALVLQKNPKAVPALRTLSTGIDVILTENSLTPDRVKAFIDYVGKDANLTSQERLILGRSVQRLHSILQQYFGMVELNVADPKVRSALEKIKKSIDDTLALYDVLKE